MNGNFTWTISLELYFTLIGIPFLYNSIIHRISNNYSLNI